MKVEKISVHLKLQNFGLWRNKVGLLNHERQAIKDNVSIFAGLHLDILEYVTGIVFAHFVNWDLIIWDDIGIP